MHIDLYQDVVCPWCRIGKRNLALALEQWQGEPVVIRYRPFFLNADMPPEGYDFRQYMLAKGGGRALETWFDAPRNAGAAVSLVFNFEAIQRAPNTLLAHRLLWLTPDAQRPQMTDALYDAYFEHGQDIGNLEVLVSIAANMGADAAALREQLAGDAARAEVLAEAYEAQRLGVSGVPLFVFNHRYAVSGAQPAQVLLGVMAQVAAGEVRAG
jgi:predicted DsbA family dithiol-disulfide isomerase